MRRPSSRIGDATTTVTEPDETLDETLDALADPDCRAILAVADEPMTTGELAAACDIALSTAYRKVEQLSATPLLTEGVRFDPDGDHASEYSRGVTDASVTLTDAGVRLTMDAESESVDVVAAFDAPGTSAD